MEGPGREDPLLRRKVAEPAPRSRIFFPLIFLFLFPFLLFSSSLLPGLEGTSEGGGEDGSDTCECIKVCVCVRACVPVCVSTHVEY